MREICGEGNTVPVGEGVGESAVWDDNENAGGPVPLQATWNVSRRAANKIGTGRNPSGIIDAYLS